MPSVVIHVSEPDTPDTTDRRCHVGDTKATPIAVRRRHKCLNNFTKHRQPPNYGRRTGLTSDNLTSKRTSATRTVSYRVVLANFSLHTCKMYDFVLHV